MTSSPEPGGTPKRVRSIVRFLVLALVLVLTVGLTLVAGLHTRWGMTAAVNLALRLTHPLQDAVLSVTDARGGFLSGVEVYGIRIRRQNGSLDVVADTLGIRYRLSELAGRPLRIREVAVAGARVNARWPLEPEPRPPKRKGSGVDLAFDRIELRRGSAQLRWRVAGRDSLLELDRVFVRGTMIRTRAFSFTLDTLGAVLRAPATPATEARLAAAGRMSSGRLDLRTLRLDGDRTRVSGAGTIAFPAPKQRRFDGTDFHLAFSPLAGEDIRRFLPALGDPGDLTLDLAILGDRSALHATVRARAERGGFLDLEATLPATAGAIAVRSEGQLRSLDWGALRGMPPEQTMITARWTANLVGQDASRISGPFSIELAGTRVKQVRLDRARLSGRLDQGRMTFTLGGAAAGFQLDGSGSITQLVTPVECDFSGELSVPPTRASDGGSVLIAGTVPIHARGRITKAGPSAAVRAELRPDASASPLLGPGRLEATLDSSLLRLNTEITAASGMIRARGDAHLGPTLSFHVREGEIKGVNLASIAGDTTECLISARFHAEGRRTDSGSVRATARVESLEVRYGPHDVREGSAVFELERGQATIDAEGIVDGGPLSVAASMRSLGPPREASVHLTFRDLELARLAAGKAPKARLGGTLSGDLSGEALRVDGRLECRSDVALLAGTVALRASREPVPTGDTLGAVESGARSSLARLLEAEVELDFSGSRIRRVTLDRALGHARLSHGRLDAALDLRAGPDSTTVSVAARPFDDLIEMRASGNVACRQIGDLLGVDSLRAQTRISLETEGEVPRSGSLRNARLSGRIVGSASAGLAGTGEARLDSILVNVAVAHGVADVERLVLRGNVLDLEGAGRIVLPAGSESADTTSFRLTGKVGALEPLAPLLRLRTLSMLGGSFRLTASGPSRATALACQAQLFRPHLNDMWADSIVLDASATARGNHLEGLDARIQAASLVVWPLTSRDLDGAIDWNGREWSARVRSILPGGRPEEIALRFEPREGGGRGRLEQFLHTGPRGVVTLQSPVEFEIGKHLALGDLVLLEEGAPKLRARGGVAEDGAVNFEVHVDSLSLDRVKDVSPSFPLLGSLSMDGTLTGTRDRPVADASLRAQLVSGGRKPADIDARLQWADGVLGFSTRFDQTDKNGLTIETRLPFTLSLAPAPGEQHVTLTGDSMAARLEARDFDLSWFQSLFSRHQARGLKGRVNGTVTAQGNPNRPSLSGSLALREGAVELPQLGIHLEDGEASVALRERTIQLERASIKSGGTLAVNGAVTLEGPGRRPIHLEGVLRRFVPVNTAQAKARLDGGITVSGDLGRLLVACDLILQKSTIYAEKGGGSSLEPVELSRRDLLDLQERFGVGVGAPQEKRPSLVDSVELDARIKIGDNVWVRRRSDPIVALELHGDFRARRPASGAPDARGTLGIRTGRSYLSFLGRRFEMVSAQVMLPGPIDSASARLEAFYHPHSGETGSKEVDVTAVVEIEPSGVTTTLRSEPYLDQASILNYLATGEVQGSLESGTAYGLAVGSALGAVGGSAGRSFGLDVVEVTTDAYGGQILGAGSYVNPSVYLGFRQPVVEGKRTGNASTSSASQTEFEVEVEALRGLLLNVQGSSAQYRFVLRPRLGR